MLFIFIFQKLQHWKILLHKKNYGKKIGILFFSKYGRTN